MGPMSVSESLVTSPPASVVDRADPRPATEVPVAVRVSVAIWIVPLLALAALLTGIDILLSMRLGLLANPPLNDGLGYVVDARLPPKLVLTPPRQQLDRPYLEVVEVESPVLDAVPALDALSRRAPLWAGLLKLSDLLFGAGDWQPFTARFWQIGPLLILVFIVVRHHSTTALAWTAVLVTGLVPTVSVSVRSATYERFVSHTVDFGREWFMADLRPDLAASVALLALIVAYFAWLERPTRGRAVVTGATFALAVLMKPTVSPATLCVLGLAGLYTLLLRRQTLLENVSQAVIAAGSGLLLLVPWMAAGGLEAVYENFVVNTTSLGPIWGTTSDGDAMAVRVAPRVVRTADFAGSTMGPEFWLVVGLGLILAIIHWGRAVCKQATLDGYCFVGCATVVLAIVMAFILRSIGAFALLLLWLAAWCLISREAARVLAHFRINQAVLPALAGVYCVAFVAAGFYASAIWPAYGRQVGQTSIQVSQAIERDIMRTAAPHDTLTSVEIWGFPLSLANDLGLTHRFVVSPNLYALGLRGRTPDEVADDLFRTCTECSVVVTLDADSVNDSPHLNSPVLTRPYQDAVAQWVKAPTSPYVLARTYPIAVDPFTSMSRNEEGRYGPSLLLFVRDDGRALPARGFDGLRDGILYGSGWYKTEIANGERFHWAGDEVELVLSPTGQSALAIEIEPGPDLAGGPLVLSRIADDGSTQRLPPIATRRTVTLDVPGAPSTKRSLRLRNESPTPQRGIGGRPLSFRVFDAYWGRTALPYSPALLLTLNGPTDIGPSELRQQIAAASTTPEDGLFVGFGWYPAEQTGGPFRWAATDCEIVVTRPTGQRRELQLELEPGPGIGTAPFELDVVDADEHVVGTVRAQGRDTVRVPLPLRPGVDSQVFRLRVRGGGVTVPGDLRILNFRVFSLRWAPN